MNLSQLSTEEIIHYIEAGIIESVPGEVVLEIFEKHVFKLEDEYQRGYQDGWNDCNTGAYSEEG